MEFLVISESKLKIMLNKSEMEKYGLDKADINYTDTAVRGAFWEILDVAAAECGFSSRGEKVLIQFYPSKSGGEIFVTKLGVLSKSAEKTINASDRVAMLRSETKIYKFLDLETAAAAVRAKSRELPENAVAYRTEDGVIYLVLELRCENNFSIFGEYGTEAPARLESYISERAEKIENPKALFSRKA